MSTEVGTATRLEHIETKLDAVTSSLGGKIDSVATSLDKFIVATDRRFQQHDERDASIISRINETGRPNYVAIGAGLTGLAILISVIGAMAVMYVGPVKAAQENQETRFTSALTAMATSLLREGEDRRRDEDKLDERLQRETRLQTEAVDKSTQAAKEIMLGRLLIDEKRIDDVTMRIDRTADEYRQKMHDIWSAPSMKPVQP